MIVRDRRPKHRRAAMCRSAAPSPSARLPWERLVPHDQANARPTPTGGALTAEVSARTRTVTPRPMAAFRFMAISNLVGWIAGISAELRRRRWRQGRRNAWNTPMHATVMRAWRRLWLSGLPARPATQQALCTSDGFRGGLRREDPSVRLKARAPRPKNPRS